MKKVFGIILLVFVGLNLFTIMVRSSNGEEIGSPGYIFILLLMLICGIILVSSKKKKNIYMKESNSVRTSSNVSNKADNLPSRTIENRFPNFYEYCMQQPNEVKIKLHRNDTAVLEFRMPIVSFGRVMGYNFVGIEGSDGKYCMYMNSESVSGRRIKGTCINLENDQSITKYEANLVELSNYLMTKTDYMKITVGEM